MSNKEKLELYKNIYFHELEVREQIVNRLNLPPVIFTALLTVYGFIMTKTRINDFSIMHVFVYFLLSLSMVWLIKASLHFYAALTGHEYSKIVSLERIDEYAQDLAVSYPGDKKRQKKELDDYMIGSYVHCSKNNEDCNDGRSLLISKMYRDLKWCVLFLGLCYPLFVFSPVYNSATKVVLGGEGYLGEEVGFKVVGELKSNIVTIELSKEIEEILSGKKQEQ